MKKDPNPCQIIGVLDDGANSLSQTALAKIKCADIVIGAERTLKLFTPHIKQSAEKIDLTGKLKELPQIIASEREKNKSITILATGDPLCHGIAPYLISRLCEDAIEITPNTSTIQIACSRLGIAWQNAKIISIHTKAAEEWHFGATPDHGLYKLARAITEQQSPIILFTSPENTPAKIARTIIQMRQQDNWQISIAENLLQEDEKITSNITPQECANNNYSKTNITILTNTALKQSPVKSPVIIGLNDSEYEQRQPEKGLITKQEVRAVTLAKMQIKENSIIWDIGAGSGSVGLEAAKLAKNGHTYALEKNELDTQIARSNQEKMGITNYTITNAKAPDKLDTLPNPDAIFIGGSGGELKELIKQCLNRLNKNGHLVMNFVTLENISSAIQELKQTPEIKWETLQLQASRSKPILDMHRMAAENPVWIITAQKQ